MTIDEISNMRVYVVNKESLENKKTEIALEQVSEGCISREAVIEWLKDKDIIKMNYQEENARRELAALPSVTPQPKIGKWIRFKNFENGYYHIKCSECGQYWSIDGHAKIFKYCFNCGAKMEAEG